jgi:hypothetical protein
MGERTAVKLELSSRRELAEEFPVGLVIRALRLNLWPHEVRRTALTLRGWPICIMFYQDTAVTTGDSLVAIAIQRTLVRKALATRRMSASSREM